jgi:hypothetical protein
LHRHALGQAVGEERNAIENSRRVLHNRRLAGANGLACDDPAFAVSLLCRAAPNQIVVMQSRALKNQ